MKTDLKLHWEIEWDSALGKSGRVFVDGKEITTNVHDVKVFGPVDGWVTVQLEIHPDQLTLEGMGATFTHGPPMKYALIVEVERLPSYELDEPMKVFVQKMPGNDTGPDDYLATWEDLMLRWGYGRTVVEAIEDWKITIEEHYEFLKKRENRPLGNSLNEELRVMRLAIIDPEYGEDA